jgi:hypothetical protein
MSRLEPIAWIALVARWVEVARASRAIPASDARLRDSIAPLIAIEANTAALGELAGVPEHERAHARDLAEISIRKAAEELDHLWRGEEWPDECSAACAAAERALRHAIYAGLEELVVTGEGALELDTLDAAALGFDEDDPATHRGTLAAMPPGSIAMPGEPIAWWCGRPAPAFTHPRVLRRAAAAPLQIYRELDERGRFVADHLASIEDDVTAGLPMLTPLLLDGTRIGRFLQPRDAWLAMQRAAMPDRGVIPVRSAREH